MPKKEWEYYSLHWIECSQQWQITQDKTNNNGNACYWYYIVETDFIKRQSYFISEKKERCLKY